MARAPDRVVFFLHFLARRDFASYRVALKEASGRTLWSGIAQRSDKDGSFVVDVPRESLPPGQFRFEVYPLDSTEPTAVYPVRVN